METPDWPKYYTHTLEAPRSSLYTSFLDAIPKDGHILDFGCGSGRFTLAMHETRPDLSIDALDMHLDEAPLLQDVSWLNARFPIKYEAFNKQNHYDGIFAWASLFFEPPERHAPLFQQLSNALKTGGTLYFSFTEGKNHELPFFSRSEEELKSLLSDAGLSAKQVEYHTDFRYSKHNVIVPTYTIYAEKAA